MIQKLDLAENTRYCQAGFEDAMPTLRGDFFVMSPGVTPPSEPPGPLLPSPLDFIWIGFFDHTGQGASRNNRMRNTWSNATKSAPLDEYVRRQQLDAVNQCTSPVRGRIQASEELVRCPRAAFSRVFAQAARGDFVQLWRNAMYGCAKGIVLFVSTSSFAAQLAHVTYHLEPTQPLSRFSPKQRNLLQKLNRADAAHLSRWKRLIVPSRWDLEELAYSPLPRFIEQLSDQPQTLFVDLPAQVFGAYEFGTLVRWGPVSSGGPGNSTLPGRYHLNWNARVRISSVNSSWIMPWYFNFDTAIGYGFHEYSLPGCPASHGCIRLLESDAKWLFHWGHSGTPVIVRGHYDFRNPRPWMKPAWWSRGITLSGAAATPSDSDLEEVE